jgi:hypothetical protein
VILLFLAAEVVVRRLLRIRAAAPGAAADLATVSKTYGGERAA